MVTKLQSQIPYIQDELPIHIPMFFYAVHPFDIHTAFEGHFVKMGDQRLMQKPSCFIWIFKHLLRGTNEPLSLQEGRRVIDIHTKYEEQQLLIQSGAWTSSSSLPESSRIVTTTSASVEGPTVGGGGGGGTRTPCSTWRLEERVSGMERRLLDRDTSTCRFNRASTGEDSLWSSSRGGNNFQPFHLSLTWFYLSTLRYGIHPPAGVEDAANCFYQGKSAFLAFCQKSNLAH